MSTFKKPQKPNYLKTVVGFLWGTNLMTLTLTGVDQFPRPRFFEKYPTAPWNFFVPDKLVDAMGEMCVTVVILCGTAQNR
jgi:hypothetical protein